MLRPPDIHWRYIARRCVGLTQSIEERGMRSWLTRRRAPREWPARWLRMTLLVGLSLGGLAGCATLMDGTTPELGPCRRWTCCRRSTNSRSGCPRSSVGWRRRRARRQSRVGRRRQRAAAAADPAGTGSRWGCPQTRYAPYWARRSASKTPRTFSSGTMGPSSPWSLGGIPSACRAGSGLPREPTAVPVVPPSRSATPLRDGIQGLDKAPEDSRTR